MATIRVKINRHTLNDTIVGPAGNSAAPASGTPVKMQRAAAMAAPNPMVSGELENKRDVEAGMINSEVMSKIPTI